jgi:hypothetical protein
VRDAAPPSAPPSKPQAPLARKPPTGKRQLPRGFGSGLLGSTSLQLKICRGNKCQDLQGALRSDPGQLFRVFGSVMSPGAKGSKGSNPDVKLKVCAGGRCVDMGPGFTNDPQNLFRMLGMVGGLLGSSLGKLRRPSPPSASSRKPSGRRDPPSKVTYRSAADVLDAGQTALGKVAELEGMEPTVVRDEQLVLKGNKDILVILDVPKGKKAQLSGLFSAGSSKVKVKFYVTEPPLAKLVRGELISVD